MPSFLSLAALAPVTKSAELKLLEYTSDWNKRLLSKKKKVFSMEYLNVLFQDPWIC